MKLIVLLLIFLINQKINGYNYPRDMICIQCEVIYERIKLFVNPIIEAGVKNFFNVKFLI